MYGGSASGTAYCFTTSSAVGAAPIAGPGTSSTAPRPDGPLTGGSDGGHADYILAAERTCIALPDELSYVDGALISCGFGTTHQGLLRVQVNGGDDLLVVGLGPVGLAAAMIAGGWSRHVYGVEASPLRQTWATGLGLFDSVLPLTTLFGRG